MEGFECSPINSAMKMQPCKKTMGAQIYQFIKKIRIFHLSRFIKLASTHSPIKIQSWDLIPNLEFNIKHIKKYCMVLQSVVECCRVLHRIAESCSLLKSNAE